MRVNDSNLNAVTTTAHTQRTDATSSNRSHGAKSGDGASDQVHLSSLSNLAASVSTSPDRASHVSRLAAAYQSGHYNVDAQAVSKSVVNDSVRA